MVRTWLKDRVRDEGGPLQGVLAAIPSALVTQAAAAGGADFVVIDREHGPIGREAMHAMIAAAGATCAPLVRVPRIDESEVKVALDAGAEGIVFPLVRSADDARRCVAAMRYPPHGVRGFGPFAAHARFGVGLGDYADAVAPHLTCAVLLETTEAITAADAILAVEGIDVAIVAQYDLSTALGVPGEFDAPQFTAAVAELEAAAERAGVALGGIAFTPERHVELAGRGYRLLLNGLDALLLADAVRAIRGW